MDLAAYCQSYGIFDGAAVLDDGNWYCVVNNALGSGYDVQVSIDDMDGVCQWQYNRDDAYARQTTPANPRTWLCYAGSGATSTGSSNPPASNPSPAGCSQSWAGLWQTDYGDMT